MSKFQTFGNISEEMVVTNTSQWLEHQGLDPDDEQYEDNNYMLDVVGKMIALDAAIFIMRRTAYLCGSNIDYLRSLYRDLKGQYKELSGGEDWDLKDFNKDIDW